MGIMATTEVMMETTTCITCGVTYAMPADLFDYHRRHGNTHYCPNGHPQCFVDPEVPRLERQLREANYEIERVRYQLDGTLQKLGETEQSLKRAQRRANAGLCPYCKRHFANVERHIQCKHKDKV